MRVAIDRDAGVIQRPSQSIVRALARQAAGSSASGPAKTMRPPRAATAPASTMPRPGRPWRERREPRVEPDRLGLIDVAGVNHSVFMSRGFSRGTVSCIDISAGKASSRAVARRLRQAETIGAGASCRKSAHCGRLDVGRAAHDRGRCDRRGRLRAPRPCKAMSVMRSWRRRRQPAQPCFPARDGRSCGGPRAGRPTRSGRGAR